MKRSSAVKQQTERNVNERDVCAILHINRWMV